MSLSDIALIIGLIFLEVLIVRLVDTIWPEIKTIIIIGAIIVDIALIAFLSSVGQKTTASITSHLEGNVVPHQITLLGEYENLGDDADLWVYVYSPSTGKYNFYEAALYYSAQRWEVRGLLVGADDENDAGKPFELGVLSADRQTSQQLRQETNEIPEDAILVSKIMTVNRIGEIVLAAPAPTTVAQPTRIPALGIGSTRIRKTDEAVMMYVPVGEFDMGSDDGNSNEQPIHPVTVDEFWIDQTEVTNEQYEHCVADGQCNESRYADDNTYNGAQQPVVGVSWNDADEYCSWVGSRLPTEAEWEYAARGVDSNSYPWGDESPNADLLNYNQNVGKTTAVGSYSPDGDSWVGASDMAGNVWEWTNSLHQPYPYNGRDGREDINSTNIRVFRGGSWYFNDYSIRAAIRNSSDPANRYNFIGFRCVQE